MELDYSALKSSIKGRVIVLCHHNADPDALCSAYALKELAMRLNAIVAKVIVPDGLSTLTRKVAEELGIEMGEEDLPGDVDTVIVVDTGSISQLEELGQWLINHEATKIFIDHHIRSPEIEAVATSYIVDESAASTCEIVYRIYEALGVEVTEKVAKVLLVGLAFDSKHFSIGGAETFRVSSELLRRGADLSKAWALLASSMGASERIARLKASQRMNTYRFGGWLVATTNLGSFQPSAARGILSLGADLVIIAGNDKEKLKASMRSTNQFHVATGIHLGRDIARPLGEEFKGAGSGHPTAAGVNGKGDQEAFLTRAVEIIKSKIPESKRCLK